MSDQTPPPAYPTAEQIKSALKPHLREVWDSASICLDDYTEDNLMRFKQLCRPGDLLLLLRLYAQGVLSQPPDDDFDEPLPPRQGNCDGESCESCT